MSSASHRTDHLNRSTRSNHSDVATGVVDVSAMTATELERFVDGAAPVEGDVRIQRRGSSAYLLTE